jgi:hypothetical protein
MRVNLPILNFWKAGNLSLERGKHAIEKERAIYARDTVVSIDINEPGLVKQG